MAQMNEGHMRKLALYGAHLYAVFGVEKYALNELNEVGIAVAWVWFHRGMIT